jgi:hypothetical protein
VDTAHRKTAARKNTKINNEIAAKGLQINPLKREKTGGNVRLEQAKPNL